MSKLDIEANELKEEKFELSPLKILIFLVIVVVLNVLGYYGMNKLLSNKAVPVELTCEEKFDHFLNEYETVDNKEKLDNLLTEVIAYNMTNYELINLKYNNKQIEENNKLIEVKEEILQEEKEYNVKLKCKKTLNISINE